MSSRTNRVTILAISKLLNFAVQFLTPIFLVRIIDRELYGQYKEFFVFDKIRTGRKNKRQKADTNKAKFNRHQ